MSNFKLIALSSLMLSVLTACGGESTADVTDSTTETVTETATQTTAAKKSFSGKVIDGYVSGATVFLDLNFNGELDSDEPSTISTDAGAYQLELSVKELECSSYVPLIVDVPVGAVDEDTGPIDEAYQMILPPSLTLIADEAILNISPITTAIWDAIKSELENTTETLSCDTLLAQEEERAKLQTILESAIREVVLHYNIAEKDLFDDFISLGNEDIKQKAIKIVKGLKKSFKETIKVNNEHPDATWIRVNYHLFDYRDGDDLYPNAWYRESYISEDGKTTFKLDKVTEDLESKVKTIIYGEESRFLVGDLNASQSFEFESRAGDDSAYSCDIKEIISHNINSKTYELTNLISKSAGVFDDCIVNDFSTEVTHRYAIINYQAADISYTSQFVFYKEQGVFSGLNDWIDFTSVTTNFEISSLTAFMEALPYPFDETGLAGASVVTKSKESMDGDNRILIRKSDDGEIISYIRTITFPNNTFITECSVDGTLWSDCIIY